MLNPLEAYPRRIGRSATLISVTTASGAIDTAGETVAIPEWGIAIGVFLDVTAAATDAADTLDVTVQTLVGSTWLDVHHFTQVLGNGGAKQFFAKLNLTKNLTEYSISSALSAGSSRDFGGDAWRVRYVQVDADNDASFTFSVTTISM